jgi:hypothetical protein
LSKKEPDHAIDTADDSFPGSPVLVTDTLQDISNVVTDEEKEFGRKVQAVRSH